MTASLLVRALLWLWFAGAVAAGHWLVLPRLHPLGLPGLVLLLAAGLLLAVQRISALRDWAEGFDLRALVLLHAVRMIGAYFVLQFQEGTLPRAFAIPAGMSEVALGVMALPIVFAPLQEAARLRAVRIWGIVGLINLLFVVFTIARLNVSAPLHLRALATLPLSLYPTFLLPLLLASGVVILQRAGAFVRHR